jgi:hypothetical protein
MKSLPMTNDTRSINPFESLAHEPCILKHGPNYDDPWLKLRYEYSDGDISSRVVLKPMLVYDIKTATVHKFPSLNETSRQLGCSNGQVGNSARAGWCINKRYLIGYTKEQLGQNMARKGIK